MILSPLACHCLKCPYLNPFSPYLNPLLNPFGKTEYNREPFDPRFLSVAAGLERIPDDLSSAADALLVGMGAHPEGDCRIAVAQALRYADDIGSIGEGNAG